TGGIFSECYNVTGGIDKVIPVDVFVPGCAARPEAIIDGVVKALDVLEEKNKRLRAMSTGLASMSIERADLKDLKEILALQKSAFQSEAEIYNDFSIAPLNQSLEELTADFGDKIFLKAVIDGRIVGSVRAEVKANRCFIGRLIVDPHFQNFGVGTRLMHAIEEACGDVDAYELHTGHKSKRNLFFYKKLGYKKIKSLKISESITRIFLEKNRRR
ncbi:MAG: GNAT family N-acetyltransferase, partial [Candidatus Omnitrophica bacterium]|nr:GNAT family N-acetyltransferase [Candidatus Omnitrophota bacterium]